MAAASFLLGMALPLLLPAGALRKVLDGGSFYIQYAYVGVREVLMLGLPALFIYMKSPVSLQELKRRMRPGTAYTNGIVMLSAVAFTMTGVLINMVWMAFLSRYGVPPIESALANPASAPEYAVAFLMAAVLPAVSEEVLFRGLLQGAVARHRGARAAIWITAVVFALAHAAVQSFAVILVIGLFLGALAVRYDSLFPGMLFHTVYNASAVVIMAEGKNITLTSIMLCTVVFSVTAYLLLKKEGKPDGTDRFRV